MMDPQDWNAIIAAFPEPHILQTWHWAQVKLPVGWRPIFKLWGDEKQPDAAALILRRSISIRGFSSPLSVLYAPKGPLLRDWNDTALRGLVLGDLRQMALEQKAMFIKIDPDIPLGSGIPDTQEARENPLGAVVCHDLQAQGWQSSKEQIQFCNTVLIDLTANEDELLNRMKQKTRYNIRLSARKGVTLRTGTAADFGMLYRMYAETSLRDGFVIRDEGYYRTVWETFLEDGMLEPLIAEFESEPVAAIMVFRFAGRAYYMHGMSGLMHREKMPNYLLQWEAMRRSKAAGCAIYDLWGAPEVFDESDTMWGVFRFKEGLGGEVLRTIGAYDLPVKRLYYRLYTQILPGILDRMRRQGKMKTQRSLDS